MGGKPPIPETAREQLRLLLTSELLADTEIAERVGVSPRTVARERRRLVEGESVRTGDDDYCHLAAGERYLPTPIRCRGCGGSVHVLPCRLCKVAAQLDAARQRRKLGSIKLRDPQTPLGQKQRELFGDAGPDLPPAKNPPAISTRYSGLTKHFRRG